MRILIMLAAALVVAGCQQTPVPDGKPLVVASFYPMYEFARQVAADRAQVISLVPPGVHGHDWEPTPQDVAQVRRARVFVYNGAGFEPWADKLIKEAAGPSTVVVAASAGLTVARTGADGGMDPHVWLDPVLAQSEVEAIRTGLEHCDPAGKTVYTANAAAYRAKLTALDARFDAGLRDCARREIVVSHAAFGYLTRRYRLEQIAVMGLAPQSEPSPAALAAIVRTARERKVTAIFLEPLVSPRLAETLAREVGVRLLMLNPIEGVTRQEAAEGTGYLDLMARNLESLRTGLECR
ncbi:MAG TPA: metal ABC transporter substrate-binding protein [Methylomirabilota bacterium]